MQQHGALERFDSERGRESNENFKVVIRVRPPVERELNDYEPYQNTIQVGSAQKELTISETLSNGSSRGPEPMLYATYRFTFDHVFAQNDGQQQVYELAARPAVASVLQGYNASIIAYGQTGTGKTYTMEGIYGHEGIVPRAVQDIFRSIGVDSDPNSQYLVRVSYLQIYNEVISDLLKTDRSNLNIREDARRGVYVDKLSEWVVRSEVELLELMALGSKNRMTGSTKMNDVSSRSHAIFTVTVEHSVTHGRQDVQDLQKSVATSRQMGLAAAMPDMPQSIRVGKLNLVDLAGSERVHITGATGKRLEESKSINQSLSALGNVIAALTDKRPRAHIPYRDSKLTRILEDSLGGNCKTTMMCMVSPALDAFAEGVSTLKFANRAKTIRNRAEVNEDADHRTLLRKYEKELKQLRSELHRRSEQLVDKRHLLHLDEQRRQAEADKLAAITELENRSRQFMIEKREKKLLEQKIAALQGQLLNGGDGMQVTPAVRKMLDEEQRKIRQEYEVRFRDLEKERLAVQDKRAQVDGYKDLLLKQRDIMMALTKRLSERDELIMSLQEELDAYDASQRRLEDDLDHRTAEVIAMRKAAIEEVAKPGAKAKHLQDALGAWGRDGADVSGKGSSGTSPRAATQGRLAGAVEACQSPGRSSNATPSDFDLGHGAQDQQLEIQEKHLNLQKENAVLREEIERLAAQQGSQGVAEGQLRDKVDGYEQERQALKVIIDSKMKLYVAEIIKSLNKLNLEKDSKVMRQSKALQLLLESTINAMSQ
eukprot:jgi/Ulvmu1/8972/UM005_0063.1